MADVNPPRDASARQILEAVARLQAELAAARAEIRAGESRAVGGAAVRGTTRVAGDVEATTAALNREQTAQRGGLDAELKRLDVAKQRLAIEERLAQVERLRTQGTLLAGGGAGGRLSDAEAAEARRFIETGGQLPVNQARVGPQLAPYTSVSEPDYARREFLASQTANMYARPQTASSGVANDTAAQLERTARAQLQYGTATQRSAALTGDFFGRMHNGTASLREMGNEVQTTITKFAGWTAAGAAVYGALSAVKQLREGAIDSASGVAQLQRFIDDIDTDQAQQSFRTLSKDLNVSIKDVADTQGQFAKVFKDYDDVQIATRVALTATKLDNIATADSYRYFTSIVQEFGLHASELPLVLDQINAAQNRLGANVQQVVPAIARSASAVKNAGGDFNELLALVATAQVSSGQTGRQIGTAFYRGAANFFQKPANAATLQSYGLNPDEGFTRLLIDAVRKSQSVSGNDRRQIAAAIFGPQYGGNIGQALLNSPDRLNKALQQTSPASAQGSTAKELQTLLTRVDQQIEAIGNGLQRLGGALGQAGAFAPLGIALRLLTSMVNEVTHLVELFDSTIPASLRPTVATLVEAAALVRVLRGTGIGAGIAQATGLGFVSDPAARARKAETSGLEATAGIYGSQAQQAAARSQALAAQAVVAQRARDELRATELVTTTDRELAQIRAQMVALDQRAAALLQESAEYAAVAERARAEEIAARERIAALNSKGVAVDAEILATEQARQPGAFGRVATAQTAGAAAAFSGAKAAEGAAVERAAVADAEIAAAQTGFAGRASAAAAAAGATATRVGVGASQVAGAGLRFGRGLLSAADGMNVVGKALTTFIIAQFFFDAVKSQEEGLQKQIDGLQEGATSIQNLRAQQQQAISGFNGSAGNIPYQIFDTAIHAPLVNRLTGAGSTKNATANAQAFAQQYLLDQSIQQARTKSADSPFERVGYSYNELLNVFAKDVTALHKGTITRAEFTKRFELVTRSASASIDVLSGDGAGLQDALAKYRHVYSQALEKVKPTADDPFVQFAHATLDENVAFLTAVQQRSTITGNTAGALTTISRGLTYLSSKYGRTNNQKDLAKVVQAQQDFDTLLGALQSDLASSLEAAALTGSSIPAGRYTGATALSQLAAGENAQNQAYDSAIGVLEDQRKGLYSGLGKIGEGLDRREQKLAALQKQRDELKSVGGLGKALGALGITSTDAELAAQIEKLQQEIKKQKQALTDAGHSISQRAAKIQALLDSLREQQFTQQSQDIQLRADYTGSSVDSKIGQLDAQVNAAQQLLDLAKNFKGKDRAAKVLQAETKLNDAISQRAEQLIQDTQEAGDLRTSEITGTGPAADLQRIQSQLTTAEQVLAKAKSVASGPNRNSDIIQAQIRVNDLRNQLAQQVQQNAKQLADLAIQLYQSQIDVKKAGLTDPIAIDKLTNQADQYALAHIRRDQFSTDTEYQIAKNQALAKQLTDRKQLTTDIANEQLSEAEFEHNVGKLTDDQYIAKLRDILKLKGISKDLKRQLLTDIYNVQHGGSEDVDLNVGNIKLPSFYDVRRALAAGRSAATNGTTVMVDNRPNVYVTVADPAAAPAVYDALDNALNTTVKANLRASGLIA